MKKCNLNILFLLILLYFIGISAANEGIDQEIRGQAATVTDGAIASWTPMTFAGFYYDIDDNLGNEAIQMAITNGKLEEPNGVMYTTSAQENDFDFEGWGWYNSIGFLGENYFAGYSIRTPVVNGAEIHASLYGESTDRNMLIDEQLLKVLKDDDTEMTVTSGTPLKMEEGYELSIKSIDIDGNKVYTELSKDGALVDSKVISPSKDAATMADKTYYYKKDIGDTKDIVIIAAHFKNAFRVADQNLATVDGIWQVSDTPASVEVDTEYDKMRIASVTADTIAMDNKDNSLTLSKNQDITLMAGIGIKTADQNDISAENPLRFYIYRKIADSGTNELKGQVQNIIDGATPSWTPQTFAGFYYDIDENLGNENIQMTITNGKLEEPNGVIYTTSTQENDFKFEDWGSYNVIGFLGKSYFAGYGNDNHDGTDFEILDEANVTNLLDHGGLTEILIDEDRGEVIDLSEILDLKENYSLKLSVGTDNKGILVELQKDGNIIDKKAVLLPGTYVFVSKVGDALGMPIIAAHFQEPILLEGKNYIKVDGLWQISEKPLHVNSGTRYGLMTVTNIDPVNGFINMDNIDNSITMSKNKEITLMGNIRIKTADQDDISADNPLRFCILKSREAIQAGGSL